MNGNDHRVERFFPAPVLALLAAATSGLLMAACYWPLNLHWLAWFAMTPLLLVLPRLSGRQAFWAGGVMGLAFYRITLDWLYGLHGWPALMGMAGFAALMGLGILLARILMKRFSTAAMLWAVPLCFVGQEVIRCEGLPLFRFSWGAWGYSQSHESAVAQLASICGIYSLTLLLAAASAAIAFALLRRSRFAMGYLLSLAAVLVVATWLVQPGERAAGETISVACVQDEPDDVASYVRLARQAAQGPTAPMLIVLPEHVITDLSIRDEANSLARQLGRVAGENRCYLAVGAHLPLGPQAASGHSASTFDNVALMFSPDGNAIFHQAKSVPVPFYDDGLPAPTQSSCPTSLGQVGLYVCYDETFTDVMRRLAATGAQIMIGTIYNKADWPVQQRWQQANMAPFRAIELRRCFVRAASSGVSQIIDATGRVLACRSQEDGSGLVLGRVHLSTEWTPFASAGYLFTPAIGVAFMMVLSGATFAHVRGLLRRWRRAPAAEPEYVMETVRVELDLDPE